MAEITITDLRKALERTEAQIKKFGSDLLDVFGTFPEEAGALSDRLQSKAETLRRVKDAAKFEEVRALATTENNQDLSAVTEEVEDKLTTTIDTLDRLADQLQDSSLTNDQREALAGQAVASTVPPLMSSGRLVLALRGLDPTISHSIGQSTGPALPGQ